jgi:endoglucanase
MRLSLPFTPLLFFTSLSLFVSACDVGTSSSVVPKSNDVTATDDSWERQGPTPVEAHGQLSVVGKQLVDQNGDAVQLKGVSSMWLNWETDGYAENAEALLWMRDHWNLSVIRAAMGVAPAGAYLTSPDSTLAQVDAIVQNAIAAGVYVLIDWHDHDALTHQDKAVEFFSAIAQKYADVPNVIYEPFNEPLAVDWSTALKPYHEAVVAAIRAADPDNVIVLGTPSWSQGVDLAAREPLDGVNLMYTLHFYSCTHTAWLRSRAQTALNAGLALFVTEWGATDADGGLDGLVCLDEAKLWLDFLATNQIGWSAWKLDNCAVDSTCLLKPNAPVNGGWTTEYLHGHAGFVRDELRR